MHIVLVDNGRSERLGKADFRSALKCIRCGACFNTCPVYRRSGGHSYHNAVAGPLGSILAPGLDLKNNADLPFASTLCGSCTNVCPVKIDIHNQLYKWRQVIIQKGLVTPARKTGIQILNRILSNPKLFAFIGQIGRWMLKYFPVVFNNRLNEWYKQRDMPAAPPQSFHLWYKQNKKNHE
jgi:L-lactate dehydrogenase complex protein LldF